MQNIVDRRSTLALGLVIATSHPMLTGWPAAAVTPAMPGPRGKTYVLVHGSWLGGWFWAPVAERLRAEGHRVFTPTQTGMGERRHLLSRDITLDTFVADVTNVIEAEELKDIILVGHSFGGVVITGVADRMPDQIRRLVYLDAIILQSGRSMFDSLPPEVAAERRRLAQEGGGLTLPAPRAEAVAAFGVPAGPITEWVLRHVTPHPIATYDTPLRLDHPIGNGRPCTYVAFTSPAYAAPEPSRRWVRNQPSWEWRELAAAHAAPAIVPDEVARLLAEID